jgi:uncharacterized membrane protein
LLESALTPIAASLRQVMSAKTSSPTAAKPAAVTAATLPPHIEQTVQAIARLHAAHEKRATPLQTLVDRMTAVVARPAFIGLVTLFVLAWITVNIALQRTTGWRFDGPNFPYLQGVGELAAIYITALVLMSQRRKDELSELREQLNLELAIMTEKKVAKLIALNEEMRRDNPQVADRVDRQAAAMAKPADPEAVLVAFKETHEGMMAEDIPLDPSRAPDRLDKDAQP